MQLGSTFKPFLKYLKGLKGMARQTTIDKAKGIADMEDYTLEDSGTEGADVDPEGAKEKEALGKQVKRAKALIEALE